MVGWRQVSKERTSELRPFDDIPLVMPPYGYSNVHVGSVNLDSLSLESCNRALCLSLPEAVDKRTAIFNFCYVR